jgi:hypothetical protein
MRNWALMASEGIPGVGLRQDCPFKEVTMNTQLRRLVCAAICLFCFFLLNTYAPTAFASSVFVENGVHTGDGTFPGFSITGGTNTPVNLTSLNISPSGATSAGSTIGDTFTSGDYFYSDALSDSAYARVEQTFMGDGETDFNYVSGLLANTLGESANASSSFSFKQAFDLDGDTDRVTYEFDYWTTFSSTVDPPGVAYGVSSYRFALYGFDEDGNAVGPAMSPVFTVDSRLTPDGLYGRDSLALDGISSGYIIAICDSFASAEPVPEPGTIVLLGMGGFGLLAYAWRRRRS